MPLAEVERLLQGQRPGNPNDGSPLTRRGYE